MSIVFSIRNKKSLFGYQKVLSAKEVLAFTDGMTTYSYDATHLNRSLNEFQALSCIVFGVSGLPLGLRYFDEEESYQIKVSSFATEDDWQLALQWSSWLAEAMGSEILVSDGRSFDSVTIFDFDYQVITLKTFRQLVYEKDLKQFVVQGFAHPVYLDRDQVLGFLEHSQPLKTYAQFIKRIQYSTAHFSQVRFYQQKETGIFLACYSLTEETDTMLPRHPHVPTEYVEAVGLSGEIQWEVQLVSIDGDSSKPESYQSIASVTLKDFLVALRTEEFEQLDANQIVIKKLSKERLNELARLGQNELV
ncbi:hypothetical protein STRDD10_00870 [Streptococcus sp. DD10]|uniref:DUF4299 family protein n=1 Tax=Streptococcus sp. DD10 TaxID=1777878 RepID=UPI000798ECEC|nr:DUF4299 family protein [Streptococcus sp. DD10]KXT74520.1 hypothetical protein STRDD10_00870 [Streptococcus sp. DD10]